MIGKLIDIHNLVHEIVNIFLSISFNFCFGSSKEPSPLDSSFEYLQHKFWLRNNIITFITLCFQT